MPPSPYRPANELSEQRWEFIYWGFGKNARRQRGFQATAPVQRSWRLGPFEIRIYAEAPKPQNDHVDQGPPPIRRIRGPDDRTG